MPLFQKTHTLPLLLSLCFVLPLGGCGASPEGPARVAVSGSVALDEAPLPEGTIRFVPDKTADGKAASGQIVEAAIVEGKYTLSLSEGPVVGVSKVMIYANRKTGKVIEAEGEKHEEVEQYLPLKYNVESTLSCELKAGEENKADFSLDSK